MYICWFKICNQFIFFYFNLYDLVYTYDEVILNFNVYNCCKYMMVYFIYETWSKHHIYINIYMYVCEIYTILSLYQLSQTVYL